MVFSHSRLNTYENCPRHYAFRYIEKPPIEERQSIEAFMGSAVHDALEVLYKGVQMERTPKWEETRDWYEAYWEKNLSPDVFIVRQEYTAQDYRNVGRRCLQDYFVRHYPFRAGRVLGLEERITLDLDDTGKYRLQGFIDRLDECDDGTIEIHDYKTSRRLPSQAEVDRERQLALYQLGIEDRWEDVRSVRLVWHYLRAAKTLTSVRSPESLEELRQATMRLIDTILAATEAGELPPRESALCEWCDYQSLCPAKRHLFATAVLSPAAFAADDGVKVVDLFAEASRRKKQADADLEAARQEVIRFAAASNMTRLRGHNLTVGISRRVDQAIPPVKTKERARLEELVRASGRWNDVSDLSRSKLPKAVQNDLFDPATREKIASLLTTKEVITVTQRRLASEETDDGPDI